MSVKLAIYRAVHDQALGGCEALAPQMHITADTLRKMADPKQSTHGWSFRRWDELIALRGTGPLEAHCIQHGGIFVPMPKAGEAPALLLKQMHKLGREFGDVLRVIEQAVKNDGRISDNELKRTETEIQEMVSAGAALLGVVRQIHDSRSAIAEEQRP